MLLMFLLPVLDRDLGDRFSVFMHACVSTVGFSVANRVLEGCWDSKHSLDARYSKSVTGKPSCPQRQ